MSTSRRPRIHVPLVAALFALLAAANPLHAQPGTLQGRVVDGTTGAPVVSATVDVNMTPGDLRRGTRTDASGRYSVTGLPTGRYRVTIRRSGYHNASEIVLLTPGETLTQDWSLTARPVVIDTLTVLADNPITVDRTQAGFDTRVSATAIDLLPLGADPTEIVALTPGARGEQVFGGATEQANQYQIDGLAANHPGVGGDLVQPSLQWLEAVEVRGLGAPAEFGNFQGGLVNLVTKSGSNDFGAELRVRATPASLASSNLRRYDVTAELRQRYDVDAEVRGPLVRDRLFYYLGGQYVTREDQVPNNLATRDGRLAPFPIEWTEQKVFGKLSWQPTGRDQLVLSGGYLNAEADAWGSSGYEAEPLTRMEAPTRFLNGTFDHEMGEGRALHLSAASYARDERRDPYAGTAQPGVMLYGLNTYQPTFFNAPFRYRQAPESLTLTGSLSWTLEQGGMRHALKAGGEYTEGSWVDQRLRNGSMTWRPSFGRNYSRFDPDVPDTWGGLVPTEWGGEIDLEADVRNAAVYLQDNIEIGRFTVAPGVRYGWWTGYITPAGDVGPRFRAMHDAAPDLRLGLTWDVSGTNDLVLRAHVGRYHQSMFAQFYERVEGGNVFSDRETWYHQARVTRQDQTYTVTERDALAQTGLFQLLESVRLNQTGPVDPDYRQPYVDELVLGAEKQMGPHWKAELVYIHRRNENMVALVDRNAATNYTAFPNVRILERASGEPVYYQGRGVSLDQVYLPNSVLIEYLTELSLRPCINCPLPPGMTLADLPRLTWDPDYVITNPAGARRSLDQVQGVVRFGYPRFGGVISAVWSRLHGNLDNVSGYDEQGDYGPGQFVNLNEGVNALGLLANSSTLELKTWVYGALPAGFRGGLMYSWAAGDRYTPRFDLSPALYQYFSNDSLFNTSLFAPVAGQSVYVVERGSEGYPERIQMDLHLERGVAVGGAEWLLEVDAVNVLGRSTPTSWNAAVNEGQNYDPDADQAGLETSYYQAIRGRVPPRTVRIGATVKL